MTSKTTSGFPQQTGLPSTSERWHLILPLKGRECHNQFVSLEACCFTTCTSTFSGWSPLPAKVQRTRRHEQLWWLWRGGHSCLANRKMCKRVCWLLENWARAPSGLYCFWDICTQLRVKVELTCSKSLPRFFIPHSWMRLFLPCSLLQVLLPPIDPQTNYADIPCAATQSTRPHPHCFSVAFNVCRFSVSSRYLFLKKQDAKQKLLTFTGGTV